MNPTTTDRLITFLGRVRNPDGGYRSTQYTFSDARSSQNLAFFGWALQQRLRPRHMLILGTTGSMWDHLFEGDIKLGEQQELLRLKLSDAVGTQSVSQSQIDALAPLLSEHLGCEVDLGIIPYCHDQAEQTRLLQIMAERVGEGEHVHLDITHGFRHLPMLALLAALHLRLVRGAVIEDIWYGSYDPDTQTAPVYQLGGLLHIADWLQALSSFDRDGDYSVFASLLAADGMPADKAQMLTRASHAENTFNFGQARKPLRTVHKALDQVDGISDLYVPQLRKRFDWIYEKDDAIRLARLTHMAFTRGDFMRVAILLPRAFLERLKHPNECTKDYAVLETIEDEFRAGQRDMQALQKHYEQAKRIRNAMAHASRPMDPETRCVLASPETLEGTLRQLMQHLLPSGPLYRATGGSRK